MGYADYAAIRAVNWSALKELRRSPMHYLWALQHTSPDADALRLGRAVHVAVFEPDKLALDFVVWKGGRRYGKEWDAFQDTHSAESILTVEQYDRVCNIRDAVRGHALVAPYLESGEPEKTICWTDPVTGIALKARLDWLTYPTATRGVVLDLKTARHATEPRLFAADAYRLGYFHQLAFYRLGVMETQGVMPRLDATIVAVEPDPPHDVTVYRVHDDALYKAERDIAEMLHRLKECIDSGEWPGVFALEQSLDMPRWAYPNIEDMEAPDPSWLKDA